MSVFQRSKFWWYEFEFRGQRFRASTSSTSKEVAKRAERARRLQLEEGVNQLKAVKRPLVFSGVAKQWLEAKAPQWSKSNLRIESYNVGHLVETFGKLLLTRHNIRLDQQAPGLAGEGQRKQAHHQHGSRNAPRHTSQASPLVESATGCENAPSAF